MGEWCEGDCWSGDGWCVGGLVCGGGVVLLCVDFDYFLLYGDYFV